MIALDTNLLTRVTRTSHAHCAIARSAINTLVASGERLVIFPQNLYEFWAVATRQPGVPPAGANGLGFTIEQASQWLLFFQRRFALLPDRNDMTARWHELVKSNGIKGFRAHDARIVAAMRCYGVERLLTFNAADFKLMNISVIDPETL